MTATPRLDNSIAGLYTKFISDAWYLDHKDSERLLDLLREMEELVKEATVKHVLDNPSLYGLE